MNGPVVPAAYRRLWWRRAFVMPAEGPTTFKDETSEVVWLQTASWHADVRLPAERPSSAGVARVADCDRSQLIWLASQTAFAGITQVDGELCTWHRLIDVSPSLEKDVGVMFWVGPNQLLERHPEDTYLEDWAAVDDTAQTEERVVLGADGLPVWLQRGDHAVRIVPRAVSVGRALRVPPEQLSREALIARADLEISYAQAVDDGWVVRLSNQPWHHGQHIDPPE